MESALSDEEAVLSNAAGDDVIDDEDADGLSLPSSAGDAEIADFGDEDFAAADGEPYDEDDDLEG
jgi:hypothetical protein